MKQVTYIHPGRLVEYPTTIGATVVSAPAPLSVNSETTEPDEPDDENGEEGAA